eukprot:3439645-Prymnesium_polylepis.1
MTRNRQRGMPWRGSAWWAYPTAERHGSPRATRRTATGRPKAASQRTRPRWPSCGCIPQNRNQVQGLLQGSALPSLR